MAYKLKLSKVIPRNFIDNIKNGEKFHTTQEFIEQKIGFKQLSRTESDCVELAYQALENLLKSHSELRNMIDVLILVTQNPSFGGIPHNSAILHGMAEFHEKCQVFDLSLGCSGYVHGLIIMDYMYEASRTSNKSCFFNV